MSLIEDALKKQQEEMNNGKRPQQMSMAPPPQSPTINEAPQQHAQATQSAQSEPAADQTPPGEQPAPANSNKNLIMGILAGVLSLAIVVVLLFQFGVLGSKPAPVGGRDTSVSTPAAKPTSAAKPTGAAPITPAVAGGAVTPKPAITTNTSVLPAPQRVEAATPGEHVVTVQPGPSGGKTGDTEVATRPVAIEIKPRVVAAPVPVVIKESVVWPDLKVTAIMNAGGGRGTAIINNNLVSEGQSVDGVDVLSISTRNGIKVSYQGEIKIIKK